MNRLTCLAVGLSLVILTSAGFAAEITKLPPTAKQLSKDEVIAAYAGKHLTWSHPVTDKGHGTTVVDATVTTMGGTYDVGGNTGEWEGKISWKGGQYCYQTRPKGAKKYGGKTCNLVFEDGGVYIEVDPKSKKVMSVNTVVQQ